MKKILTLSAILLLTVAKALSVLGQNDQSTANQQMGTVTCIVSDKTGALPGASVFVKGTANGQVTDNAGRAVLHDVAPDAVLVISFIGYTAVEVNVNGRASVSVLLEDDSLALDELVVVGYGTQKKVNLSGAVSSIETEQFERRPIVSASVALQGLAPGVTVTTGSGAPGNDGGSIRIRGIGTFGGSSSSPLVLIDGVQGDLDTIDPDQIESISVLKDAASSSIYGSRAANGVILVTTKRGSEEKFSLNYKGYFGWQTPTDLPDLTDAYEYRKLFSAMTYLDTGTPYYTDEELEEYKSLMGTDDDHPNTDWQKVVLTGSGFTHNHNLSLGVSSEKVRMLTSLGYSDQQGIITGTSFQRYSFRNNADVKFNDRLSMKLDLSFTDGERYYSPYQSTAFNYMNTRPADILAKFSTGLYSGLGLMGNNPIALLEEGGQVHRNSINATGSLTLTYSPVDWLSFSGMIAPKYITKNVHNWKKSVTTYQDAEGSATLTSIPFDQLTESAQRQFYWNCNFLVNLHKSFGKHELGGVLGVERNTYTYHYLEGYRENFSYDYDQLSVGNIDNLTNDGYMYEWALQSYFGRINYNYAGKYLVEANLRIDGSSRFSKKNRWGYFPSVSAAWRVSEEPFWEGIRNTVNNLKVRASYGTLGNQSLAGSGAASYYPTTSVLSTGNISMNDIIYPIAALTTLANEDITWETSTMLDAGVDISLFRHLSITADWYKKKTSGILMTLDIPLGIGLNAPYQNAGKVDNTGWEVGATYSNQWKDFSLSLNGTVSDVVNKITDMHGKTSTSGVLRNQEGYSVASIYALDCLGIIRTQEEADEVNANCPQFSMESKIGDLRYRDVSGDGKITADDYTIVGSTIPRYTYSLNVDFGWKNLRLAVLFQGVGKANGYLDTYYVMPSHQGGNFRKEYLDYTWEENPDGSTPRLSATNSSNWQPSSWWMRDASYLRVKNLQLGYALPKKWVGKIGLRSAYIYANAQNLFTFTNFYQGYDPEVNYNGSSSDFDAVSVSNAANYPQVKIFTFGVDIKF